MSIYALASTIVLLIGFQAKELDLSNKNVSGLLTVLFLSVVLILVIILKLHNQMGIRINNIDNLSGKKQRMITYYFTPDIQAESKNYMVAK